MIGFRVVFIYILSYLLFIELRENIVKASHSTTSIWSGRQKYRDKILIFSFLEYNEWAISEFVLHSLQETKNEIPPENWRCCNLSLAVTSDSPYLGLRINRWLTAQVGSDKRSVFLPVFVSVYPFWWGFSVHFAI